MSEQAIAADVMRLARRVGSVAHTERLNEGMAERVAESAAKVIMLERERCAFIAEERATELGEPAVGGYIAKHIRGQS